MKLDPQAKEAAHLWVIEATSDGGVSVDDYINGILNAYLSTLTPVEVGGLVERLRGTHTCDGCGEYVGSIIHDLCDEAAISIENLSIGLATVWRGKLEAEDALASERAAHAETKRERDEARQALEEIRDLKERPYEEFPADWREQIAACPECQRYADHPIQRGICNEHRRPLYAREDHDKHETKILGYRAKGIARDALDRRVREGGKS